jgi:23S rRNA pseudouridine1911/1915/1917 synthase
VWSSAYATIEPNVSSRKQWVVRDGDGTTVGDIVRRAGADARAITDGRVFVGRRRATSESDPVCPGNEVTISAELADEQLPASILLVEGDLIAADKPAGMPTIPDQAGASHALLASVARALGKDPSELHPTSRLDRDVSGVVFFSTHPDAAARLRLARDEGRYTRRYVGLAARSPTVEEGAWTAPIGRAKDPRHRAVNGREATSARTLFRVVATAGQTAMLALAPITGRTHQLRVHASHAGAPLLGDRVYGGPSRLTVPTGPHAGRVLPLARIALHAARVVVPLAHGGGELAAVAPIPEELRALWSELGGDAGAWDTALSCDLSDASS